MESKFCHRLHRAGIPVHYCGSEVGVEVRVLPTGEEHCLITLYAEHGIQSSAHILLRKGCCLMIVGDVKDRPLTIVYTGEGHTRLFLRQGSGSPSSSTGTAGER